MNLLFAFTIACSSQFAAAHKVVISGKEIDLDFQSALTKVAAKYDGFVADNPIMPNNLPDDEPCLKETNELADNSDLVSATNNLQGCPMQETQTPNEMSITIDYSSCTPQLGNYQLACTSAGGELDTIASFNIECTAEVFEESIKVSMNTLNMPDCLGESCEGSLKDYIENNDFQQELADELENMFTLGGGSADCTVQADAGSSSDDGNGGSAPTPARPPTPANPPTPVNPPTPANPPSPSDDKEDRDNGGNNEPPTDDGGNDKEPKDDGKKEDIPSNKKKESSASVAIRINTFAVVGGLFVLLANVV